MNLRKFDVIDELIEKLRVMYWHFFEIWGQGLRCTI